MLMCGVNEPLCGLSVGCGVQEMQPRFGLGFGVEISSWCEAVREHDMARLHLGQVQ